MEKRPFFVSVQGRSLLEDPGAAAYEWEVQATRQEADTLSHMLEQLGEKEESGFLAFTYPWPDTPEGEVNRSYDSLLNALYREIYRLGTAETRAQMERSGFAAQL
ncbi:hypothetical protein IM700_016915 [Paenibacillus sp. DXFW5]|uniref:Hydrolase n=1 Tax=Paenibacillus rhizolycopersici TaxID=2780073 RepID=A0ABS2H7D8_9BACL|nr:MULTISPECIES: hypothetical protein [Paenibacillus]MBM6997342.1 hypothetical protein [Paenibacillus rhizolycopersici]GIP49496.1 hypothetical protein J53TS2_30870 [Paenibacillus sp. J53TS2]